VEELTCVDVEELACVVVEAPPDALGAGAGCKLVDPLCEGGGGTGFGSARAC
jgi:hypothetical protein